MIDVLRDQLRDERTLDGSAKSPREAPPGAPLGAYAFSQYRIDVPMIEQTDDDMRLYEELQDYIKYGMPITPQYIHMIQKFMQNGWYKKIFHAPKAYFVMRGMHVSKVWLENCLKRRITSATGTVEHSFTFSPRQTKTSSTWSISQRVADYFSSTRQQTGVVMTAALRDNPGKFMECDGLYGVYMTLDVFTMNMKR